MKKDELYNRKEEFLVRLQEAFGGHDMVEKQKFEVAATLGLEPDDISVRMDVLATTMSRDGVLARVHIGRTRFTLQLSAEDLGLKPDNEEHEKFLDDYIKLGSKYLISASYIRKLDRIETAARRAVEKWGFRTQWGIFVPYTNVRELREEIDALRDEYLSIRDEILARYPVVREETAQAYRAAAVEAWKLLHGNDTPTPEFVSRVVGAAMSAFPPTQRIEDSFHIDLEIGFVPLTSFIEEERARARLTAEREQMFKRELQSIESERAEAEQVRLERLKTRLMRENYKRERIKELHREALESYKRQVDGFFGDVVGRIYGIVYEAVSTVSANLDANGSLGSGDVKRIKSLVERIGRLNFMNDEQVGAYLDKLRRIADTPAETRAPADVMKTLNDISAQSRQVLTLLGCAPRAVRGLAASDIELPSDNVRVERRVRDTGGVRQGRLFDETGPLRRKRVV